MASRPPSGPSPNAATPGPKVSNATARANCSKESGVKPQNWCPTFTSGIEQAATWLLSPCIRRAVAPVPHPIRNVGCESLRQARQAPRQLVGHCGSIWLNETAVGPPWHTKIRPCAARRVKWFGLDPLATKSVPLRLAQAGQGTARYGRGLETRNSQTLHFPEYLDALYSSTLTFSCRAGLSEQPACILGEHAGSQQAVGMEDRVELGELVRVVQLGEEQAVHMVRRL